KRITFHVPDSIIKNSWLRVRDEGDKITMSLKKFDGPSIEKQQEICLVIDNFDKGIGFLTAIGFKQKSYQETKRELWVLDGVEITIDEWPYLEPFVEVEAETEEGVKDTCKKIGLNYNNALFCPITILYSMKYNISADIINKIPKITFLDPNPFNKFCDKSA
ncbi:MAG: CYTH domain-containing protein, partial [bacterium]